MLVLVKLPADVEKALVDSPIVSALLNKWHLFDLPDAWLVAGIIVQTYWNAVHGYSYENGIVDADIIYFDRHDLSEETEANHATRIRDELRDIPVRFDVKNEARVHLWYESRFGYSIEPYVSVEHAISTFPTIAGSIGIRPTDGGLECCAPFGVDDLLALRVRPNKRQITREIYEKKVARWAPIWDKLIVAPFE